MKWVGFLIISAFFVLTGCSEPKASKSEVEERVKDVVNDNFKEDGISEYIAGDIQLSLEDLTKAEYNNYYYYDVKAEVNDSFDSSSDENVYKAMMDLSSNFQEADFDCGENSECTIDTISLVNGGDTYEVETQFNASQYISINGDDFKPEEEVEEAESSPVEETNTSEESAIEEQIEIYNFMKSAFDELTNFGETYIPEVHDPQIAELAASKFGITAEEANQIYIDFEMKQAGY